MSGFIVPRTVLKETKWTFLLEGYGRTDKRTFAYKHGIEVFDSEEKALRHHINRTASSLHCSITRLEELLKSKETNHSTIQPNL